MILWTFRRSCSHLQCSIAYGCGGTHNNQLLEKNMYRTCTNVICQIDHLIRFLFAINQILLGNQILRATTCLFFIAFVDRQTNWYIFHNFDSKTIRLNSFSIFFYCWWISHLFDVHCGCESCIYKYTWIFWWEQNHMYYLKHTLVAFN